MFKTSIGYHTFTIFKALAAEEAYQLLLDFKKYSKKTGAIKINRTFKVRKNGKYYYITNEIEQQEIIDDLKAMQNKDTDFLAIRPEKIYTIKYKSDNKGINKWLIRICNGYKNFKSYIVEATINTNILVGIRDYIKAANEDNIKSVEFEFNQEAKQISTILGQFFSYKVNRVDYCINFDLIELGITCSPEKMMELIKRSNIPAHFKELTKYDNDEHRMKSDANSFYLTSNSVVINCYYKYAQLNTLFSNCPSLAESRSIIRFEVQCKYQKMHFYSWEIRKNGVSSLNEIFELLSNNFCRDVVAEYLNRVLMSGDYYTLKEAIMKVKFYNFQEKKEQRMIDTLNLISSGLNVLPENTMIVSSMTWLPTFPSLLYYTEFGEVQLDLAQLFFSYAL